MTDCLQDEIRDRLPEYVHGTLGPAERARVDTHVATCAACFDEVALLRAMGAAMTRNAPAIDARRVVAAARGARAARSTPKTRPEMVPVRRPVPQIMWRAAAAVLVVATGAAGYYLGRVRPETAAPVQVAASPAVTLPRAMTRSPVVVPQAAPVIVPAPAPVRVGLTFGGGVEELSDAQASALISDLEKNAPAIDPEPEAVLDLGGTR